MKELVIIIKDDSKEQLLLQLLSFFDFIEIKKQEDIHQEKEKNTGSYDFFQSAGLFKNRSIEAGELRKKAWKL